MSLSTTVICFIACHGGPADHFAIFANHLKETGHNVEIHASGPALSKFDDRGFSPISFSTEEPASEVAKKCASASVIITDIGHAFAIDLQKALSEKAPLSFRYAYYDNPESFVPGGYSEIAAEVMELAQKVLFANSNIAIDLAPKKGIPIGYYPMGQVEKIKQRREQEHVSMRSRFFSKYSLEDTGQKVLVYAGGNNEEYFSKAFPAFLSFLDELPQNFIVLLQQHPGAKTANRDKNQIQGQNILISDFSSDDAQVLADAMLYYQTSMGPQFALAGIPVIQVGHEVYQDILVKNNLCSVAITKESLLKAITDLEPNVASRKVIEKGLGICLDWAMRLENAIFTPST
jgi:hypothetical protein